LFVKNDASAKKERMKERFVMRLGASLSKMQLTSLCIKAISLRATAAVICEQYVPLRHAFENDIREYQ